MFIDDFKKYFGGSLALAIVNLLFFNAALWLFYFQGFPVVRIVVSVILFGYFGYEFYTVLADKEIEIKKGVYKCACILILVTVLLILILSSGHFLTRLVITLLNVKDMVGVFINK